MKRKTRAVVSRNAGILLRRIAQEGGVLITHYGDAVVYSLRNSGEQIRPRIVERLVAARLLLNEDRGLFDQHPQSYRTRLPSDGKL
jgi:hypothetical protein